MKSVYIFGLLLLSINLFSQRGKDGTVTIGAANTVVNAYTSLTSNVTSNSTTLQVGNSGAFSVGDLILIIQMQGTSVNAYHGGTTGPWFDSNSALPTDSSFGRVINYYNTGKNEFAQINSIPDGTSIIVDCGLVNDYDVTKTINTTTGNINLLGRVQVIKVPRYAYLTVSGVGSITCPQWNGSTGGIAVVEVEHDASLTATGSFNVAGKGFRGGAVFNYTPSTIISSDKSGSNLSQEGGTKGESIAGDTAFYRNYASVFARGALANGGGGGNSHNSGGGGGANGHNGVNYNGRGNPVSGYNTIWNLESTNFSLNTSSGGGRGGYSFSNSNQNVSTVPPGTYSTATNAWGGDKRRAVGGWGGHPLNYINGTLFLGGGGGSGQGNDNKAGAGGNGGGMVYVVCYGNLSGSGTIIADGANGSSSSLGCSSNDGAGGGGGGGTIVLNVSGTTNLTAGTALSANGGTGGNVAFNCALPNATAYGPGAGGGGGYIASSGTLPGNSVNGGNNGIVSGNANNIGTNFPPNGATKGGSGGTGSVTNYTLTASANQTICTNQTFTVTASSTQPGTSINWYTSTTGGTAVSTGTAYAAPGYTAAGTYTLYAGACPGTYRQPIIITVAAGLTISANSPTICPNQTVTLTASGATTYTWNPGNTTGSSISVSPSSTTVYTINGTSGLCTGTHTTNVIVSSTPTVSVANGTVCSGNSTTLTASGASSYTWAPGAQTTSSIVVTPTINTTYTITGSNGACTNTTTASVSITPTPTLTANSATICPGQVATFTVSGAASYTWNPGGTTGTTFTISSASSGTVSVTGANGSCSSQITRSVTVSPSPTITVSNQTICPTQTITLTAGGATTYTWNTGQNTNTISVSPSSLTVYTVSGTSGSCSSSKTVTVTVASSPTVSVANGTVCSGNSTTLTANGATSYTWAPGAQTTSSIVVTPTINTTYTITGSNGVCTNSTTASVSITPTPTLTANSATICPGQVATFTVSGAGSYTWNPGAVTGTTFTISPASSGTVSVTGANGSCVSQITRSVTVNPSPTITVSNQTICPSQTITLTAGGATSYTWSTGPNTNTISVSPSSLTVYTVSGTTGSCSSSNTVSVMIAATPTLSVANATLCSGNSTTLTASGATNYTWSPGSQTTASISVNPSSSANYTVIGSNGTCTNSAVASVSVTATPTLVTNSSTICPGQTATLTVSGAASYTWNPGAITGISYTISPASNTVVTVDGANGTCTSQATASVTIGTGISISVNNPTICAGQTASLTAVGATSYTWDTGANTNTLNVSPANTTTYVVSGTSGTCSGSNTAVVTVVNQLTVSVTSSTICSGNSTILTASGAGSYTWSPGSQTTATISVSPSSSTDYTVTGSNGTCTNSAISNVSVTTTPTLIVSSATICSGQTATLTASGATNYTWMPGGQLTSGITDNPSSTTIYTVTGANGTCTTTANGTIDVTTTPTLVVNSATICSGQTATLTASGATTYTWNPGNLTGTPVTVTPTISTTYTITGANGACTGAITSNVDVINCNSVCSFNLGNDTAFCSPMNYTINGPSGFTSYSWTPGGATTQNMTATATGTYICTGTVLSNDLVANGNFSLGNTMFTSNYVVPSSPGPFGLLTNPGTYLVTTDPNSAHNNFVTFGDHTTGTGNMMVCNGSAVPNDVVWSETITVTPNTNYNFSAWVASVYNTSAGNEAQLQFSINNGLLGTAYSAPFTAGVWANFSTSWNSGVSTSAVITIVDQNFTAPGANDFALDDVFFQKVCSYSDTIIVTENQTPTLTVSTTNSVICMGNSTSLTASGASTYTWSGGVTNGSNFSPTVTATYSVTGTSVAGCTNTSVQTITVNSIPTVSVTSANICSGQSATLIASGANTYTWSNGVNGNSQTVNPSITAIYTVSGTDLNGCVSSSAATSTVNVTTTPTITVNSPTVCAGQTATLIATGAANYTWSTTETTASINTTPALTSTYSVVGNNGVCSTTSSVTVSVTPSPTITASSASLGGCAPFCTSFTDAMSSSATSISYNFGDSNTANTNNPNHCYTSGGSYTVTATATNSVLGCSSTFTLPVITVFQNAVADFNVTEGNVVTVGSNVNFINSSANASSYIWDVVCTGQTSATTDFMTAFADTGNCCISLIANNSSGCPDTVVKCINIVKEAVVVIPNVFTPNGDHANDVFRVTSSGLKSLNCVIFDRWGLRMFEWDGINGFWDGSAKSGNAPDGTYFYIINYTDQLDNSTTEKGFLNLFRD